MLVAKKGTKSAAGATATEEAVAAEAKEVVDVEEDESDTLEYFIQIFDGIT